MVPQISKEILSNFSYKYKRCATNIRCTRQSIPLHNQKSSDKTLTVNTMGSVTCLQAGTDGITGISMSNYTRCYVEDFMTRDIG